MVERFNVMPENNDTIVAIATPPGKGGIGVIRVSGNKSKAIFRSLTSRSPVPRQAQFVNFTSSSDEVLDKGIAIYFAGPASYTGEDIVECHAHGSRILLDLLVEEIISLGARAARPGEFTERAFLNDKIDLVQAEAVADLIDSNSKKAARSAMQSLDGAFSNNVKQLRELVFNARSLIEAALDFPDEEDVDINIEPAIENIETCLASLKTLLQNAENGRVLEQSPVVVIVGSPNAGKSSLINCLSGYDAAIVSAAPGTTRDTLRENVLLGGYALTLIDTAGIRETKDAVEKEGVNRAMKAISAADIVLHVIDNKEEGEKDIYELITPLPANARVINVRNKIDIHKKRDKKGLKESVYISAKTEEGLDELIEKITSILDITDGDENIIFARQRHIDALRAVEASLRLALKGANSNAGLEVMAESLRQALSGFDDVTGKTTVDDVLGNIFSQFCIGK